MASTSPTTPPIEPMLAKIADELPAEGDFLYEPKWDGFGALQQRLHPAASRVAKLSQLTPASFVAFDLLAAGGRSTMALPQAERRVRLERLLGQVKPPVYLTPVTRDREVATDWLARFEGAGLDG